MAERVFLHIGLPKTGTTYLQQILWSNRDRLERDGVVLPGKGHREHLWAALEVRESPSLSRRHPRAPGTWERLCAQVDATPGTALITHEFLCGATVEQARRAVERLAPAEVSVVVTARHAAAMLTAGWQEMVKNGGVVTPQRVMRDTSPDAEFGWQTWDLGGVLERWSSVVPPERIHVLPLPPPASAGEHWENFARVLGLAGAYEMPEEPANASLGVVQVELLRRVNQELDGFQSPTARGVWIRGYLAEDLLARQRSERFALPPALVEDCRARSRRAVDLIRERGIRVEGDLDSLLVPDELRAGRARASVTDRELLGAATTLVADLMADVRRLTEERRDGLPAGRTRAPSDGRGALRRLARAARRRTRRLRSGGTSRG